MRKSLFVATLLSLIIWLVGSIPNSVVYAQQKAVPIKCGSVVDAEFTKPQEAVVYSLAIDAGAKFSVTVTPAGDTLQQGIVIYGPGAKYIAGDGYYTGNWNGPGLTKGPSAVTPVLAARGTYFIIVSNTKLAQGDGSLDKNPNDTGGVGSFTTSFGCTMKDGTIIAAGSSVDTSTSNNPTSGKTAPPAFGFAGLPSVDFASAAIVPLQPTANDGSIPATGNTILGYKLQGKANNKVDLSFTRVSGNLNLGLVVISADNKVIFQASLVNSTSLTTEFTLPADGTYTIGIFQIALLPPAKPEATEFQLQAQVK